MKKSALKNRQFVKSRKNVKDIRDNLLVQPDVYIIFLSFIFTKLVATQTFELLDIQNIMWDEKAKRPDTSNFLASTKIL